MRFVFGPIPPSQTVDANGDQWIPMTSSNEVWYWRYLAIAGLLVSMVAAFLALQQAAFASDVKPWRIVAVVALTPFLIPLHEFAHCVGYFVPLRSPSLITGICLARGTWYVVYDSPLPRWRVLSMLVAPFALLAIAPCLAFAFLTGSNAWLMGYLVLIQTGLCIGDLITLIRIYVNVPAGCLVHNRGWTTCWRVPELS